jgi:hypothetical protein
MCADRHLLSPSSKKSEESTVLNSMTRWIYRRLTFEQSSVLTQLGRLTSTEKKFELLAK